MGRLLTLSLLFFTGISYGQTPKTLPGVFTYDLSLTYDYVNVSQAGNSIALRRGSNLYVFFDFQKGAITQLDRGLTKISSNHRYLFEASRYLAAYPSGSEPKYGWQIKSAGIYSDTALRTIITDHLALDMDDKGNILATSIWYDSTHWYWSGMKGLYKLDRTSGKVLQTINEDTIFVCNDRMGCAFQGFYLQKKYFAYAPKTYGEPVAIYPLDGSQKSIIPAHNYHTVYADSTLLFTVGDSTLDYRKLTAFDVRTGQQLAQKRINRTSHKGQLFSSTKNKLYILQIVAGTIEEWSVENGEFINTKTWDVNATMQLAKDQTYEFFVAKGPSFFVVPVKMNVAEAGGFAANTAHVLNGASNKITMQVFPFYNRTADDVAKQAKAKADQDAYLAKYKAKQDSLEHPEKYCHLFWNTDKWRKGLTIFWGAAYHILADYDCKEDKYKLWRPAQLYEGKGHYMEPKYILVPGDQIRTGNYYSKLQYVICEACEGDGTYERTVYTTKTKELPWGYFSGIETKKITTTSTTTKERCSKCMGNGVVLK
jgi:hypothetical protein